MRATPNPASPANLGPRLLLGRRRRSLAAALALGAAATGAFALVSPALAQLKAGEATVETPFGRAPLSFADIIEKVKPAVVSIQVVNGGEDVDEADKDDKDEGKRRRMPEGFPRIPGLPEDFFDKLPKEFGLPRPDQMPMQGQGSGFVITADGYVVTNNHVVEGANKIEVSFDDREKLEAELIGTDVRTDLALIKIKKEGTYPTVKFATKPVRVGDWALAIGNPFGLGGSVTAGIVSALSRDINDGPYDFMQIDAAVNKGNSGGPTFNLEGEVIGVNTAIYSPSGGNVGIAFAVPAQRAQQVIEELKSHGSVSRGWLGVKIQPIDEDTAEGLRLDGTKGALVSDVTAGSPAAKAGLKVQDAILAVNGERIEDPRDLSRRIAEMTPDTEVDVKIWRDGGEQVVKVMLGTFPKTREELAKLERGDRVEPAVPGDGMELEALGLTLSQTREAGEEGGVAIAEVAPRSPAAKKGLKAGDVILFVDNERVSSADDVMAGVKKVEDSGRDAVVLRVKTGEQERIVGLRFEKS